MACSFNTPAIILTVLLVLALVLGIVFHAVAAAAMAKGFEIEWVAEGSSDFTLKFDSSHSFSCDYRLYIKRSNCQVTTGLFEDAGVTVQFPPDQEVIDCNRHASNLQRYRFDTVQHDPCLKSTTCDTDSTADDASDDLVFWGWVHPFEVNNVKAEGDYRVRSTVGNLWAYDACKEHDEAAEGFGRSLAFIVLAIVFYVASCICCCVSICCCFEVCGSQKKDAVAPETQVIGQVVPASNGP